MSSNILHNTGMLTILGCVTAVLLAGCTHTNTEGGATMHAEGKKLTFVIVHGAWGGGWSWKEVDQLLTADGHTVYRPTLTGQGERVHLASPTVGLDTHIQDIVNVIRFENLHDIVLVGHSYGGMVITGVAERVPERISKLIYLDALLPEDGESVDRILPLDKKNTIKDGLIIPGWKVNPQPPGDVPQPAKTFSDPISVNNPASAKLPGVYILFVLPGTQMEMARFYRFYQRAKAHGWPALTMDSDHNAWNSHPKELVNLLEKVAK